MMARAGGQEVATMVNRSFTSKKSMKGEDFSLSEPEVVWPRGSEASNGITFGCYGIFDGHGGQGAALMSKTHIVNLILDAMDELVSKGEVDDAVDQMNGGAASSPAPADSAGDPLFDLFLRNIPHALRDAFEDLDRAVHKVDDSGTTATVVLTCGRPTAGQRSAAALSSAFAAASHEGCSYSEADVAAAAAAGWGLELYVITANVGDSHAFFYSGVQTTMLNADHRLDANKGECERIRRAGGRIDNQETKTERGPSRLYPGGLMMSRTLGDRSAPHAIATPEVSTCLLPPSGGRVIIASDGLWDIASGKQAAKIVHMKAVQPACQLLVSTAQRKDSRDDITVTVIDILPSDRREFKLPWSLPNGLLPGNSHLPEVDDPTVAWDPFSLEQSESAAEEGGFEASAYAPPCIEVRQRRQRLVAMEAIAARNRSETHAARVALMQQQSRKPGSPRTGGASPSSAPHHAVLPAELSDEASIAEALRQSMLGSQSAGNGASVRSSNAFAAFNDDDGGDGAGGGSDWTSKPKKVSKKQEAIRATAESACDSLLDVLLSDAAREIARLKLDEEEAARAAQKKQLALERKKKLKEKRDAEKRARKEKAIQRAVELAAANAAAAKQGGQQQELGIGTAGAAAGAGAATARRGEGPPGFEGGGRAKRSDVMATKPRRERISPLGADDLQALKSNTPPPPPAQQQAKSNRRPNNKDPLTQNSRAKSGLFDLLPPSPINKALEGGSRPSDINIGESALQQPQQRQQHAALQSEEQHFVDSGWGELASPSADGDTASFGFSSTISTPFSPITNPSPAPLQPPGMSLDDFMTENGQGSDGSRPLPSQPSSSSTTTRQQRGSKKNGRVSSPSSAAQSAVSPGSDAANASKATVGEGAPEVPTRNLHVSRYGTGVTKEEICALFSQHVEVKDVILKEHVAGGYAFVNTMSIEGALVARDALAGTKNLRSKVGIKINFAKDRFAKQSAAASDNKSSGRTTAPNRGNKANRGEGGGGRGSGGGGGGGRSSARNSRGGKGAKKTSG